VVVPKVNWEINVGTFIHLGVLLVAIALGYAGITQRTSMLEERFTTVDSNVRTIHQQTNRIEHYLSSQDPDYWKKTYQNGDAGNQ
jgi:hypothetical protein